MSEVRPGSIVGGMDATGCEPPPEAPSTRRPAAAPSTRVPGIAVGLLFFLIGLAISRDIGLTADEFESINAGRRNLEIAAAWLAGEPLPEWSFHELTGYYFVLDTGRALFAAALESLTATDVVRAFHLAHLLLASLALYLLTRVAQLAGASARTATLAAVALGSLPKFVAHSQNNPKDLPALFVFVLAVHGVLRVVRAPGLRSAVLAGPALGLALTSRVLSIFAPLVGGLWIALRAERPLRSLLPLLATGAIALLCALAFWPWLWSAPLDQSAAAFAKLTSKVFTIPVLYLGTVLPANEVPWHYRSVLLLATTPVLTSLLALGSIPAVLSARSDAGLRNTALLGWIWFGVLLAADGLTWSRYDGIRHFLPALPGLALLAGSGAELAIRVLDERLSAAASSWRRAGRALPLLPFVASALAIAAIHPYTDAYLNAPTRMLLPGASDRSFEIEYWGQSYQEGAAWLNAHAEPDAELIVPLFANVARHSLTRPVSEGHRNFGDTARPRYLMMITRRAYYDSALAALEQHREPVFQVDRSGGRLLAIFRNDAPGSGRPIPPR